MWINKAELAWRRRCELRVLQDVARQGEGRFVAFALAVDLLLANADGRAWLARHGIHSHWCQRSWRLGKGGAFGLSVLEGVVLAATCSHLLDDAALVRWMSRQHPAALELLHQASAALAAGRQGDASAGVG